MLMLIIFVIQFYDLTFNLIVFLFFFLMMLFAILMRLFILIFIAFILRFSDCQRIKSLLFILRFKFTHFFELSFFQDVHIPSYNQQKQS